jgi:signal transduction histidine kinase/FixJ family two-component response regulator
MVQQARAGEDGEKISDDAFVGGGAMGALMRDTDWASTPMGPVGQWPQSLRSAVSIMLNSRYPIAIYWGADLALLYNDAWMPILGTKHPWALARGARAVWPEIWDAIGPLFRRVVTTGEGTWSEDELLPMHRHGYTEECYFNFTFSPIRGERGRVEGIFNAVVETTFRVIGERRTRTLRNLAERTAGARSAAEACALAVEALSESAADVPFCRFHLPDPETPPPSRVARVLETGQAELVSVSELGFTTTDGPWPEPTRDAYIAPLFPGGRPDQPLGALVMGLSPRREFDDQYRAFADQAASHVSSAISNALAYEAERRRAEALAELDRAKTAFFSNVSHEFRTPLTLMLGPLEELRGTRQSTLSSRERTLVDLAHRNSLRLLKLVNSLLDFSRIEAGRVDVHFEATDFAACTAELASAFRSSAEQEGLRFVVRAPPLGKPVYLDRDLWEKVVLNLVSNAFKHTFEGEIIVEVRERDGRAELEVRDTGVGIADGHLDRVFERFHRVPNVRARTHEGSGIGLALVQELVKLHDGSIRLESAVGVGTSVVVSLPFGASHAPRDQVGEPRPHAANAQTLVAYLNESAGWHTSGEYRAGSRDAAEGGATDAGAADASGITGSRVLVADDNADMSEYVSRLLRERGCVVDIARDGREALAMARMRQPDLVLSDVMMPGLDGFELLAALRADEHTNTIPVILLSARAGEEARVEGVEAGADDYLVKPFSARELVARVESHLQRAHALASERRATTEREHVLAAVNAERARLRELLAQAPAAIAVFRGPDHVYELTNPPYLRFIGGRDVIGKTIREALPELEGQGVFELLDEVYRTGEPKVMKELGVMLDADGDGVPEEIFFNFVYQPIRNDDEGGGTSGIFVQAVDVTEQVRARRAAESMQRESDRARASAESASRAKSDFLAAMSHELRTPLNAIAGYAQLMLMELHGPITQAQREALERVERSQRHLLRLINEVLNLARVESGRVDYDIQDFPVQQVVAELGPMVQPQFDAKTIRYEVRLPEEPVMVRADRDKVMQILINVLANAAKFTPAGGLVTIEALHRAGVSASFIRITDTGIGIPRDKQPHIFEPFVQVHTGPTRVADGAGLGLAISYDLAKAMGGDLRVRSEEGKGARFTLSLPRGESRA